MSWMNKKNFAFYIGFFLLVAVAFFLRLYRLDERVFHHDEAAVGYFTYRLFIDNSYTYDPAFHGPFMYYATTEIFKRFGDSIYSARILPAILGSAMLLFLLPLRKYLGGKGILIAAFLLAFSPSFLYYSRFYREDIFISFFSLLLFVCAIKFAEDYSKERTLQKRSYFFTVIFIIILIAALWVIPAVYLKLSLLLTLRGLTYVSIALIALCFILLITGGYPLRRFVYLVIGALALSSLAAIKENAYVSMALIGLFLFLLFIKEKCYKGLIGKIKSLDYAVIFVFTEVLLFTFVFAIFFSLYYTGNFLDLPGMNEAFMKAVSHWYEMHKIERMAGPFFFYLPIIAMYELPIFIFGLMGIVHYGGNQKKNEKILIAILSYWIILDIMYYLKYIYPDSGRFLPISYIPDSIIIYLPLLIYAIITVLRSSNLFLSFLVYWTLTNFIVYSYLQEKVPWLVLNPLLPLSIIAAVYLCELLSGMNFKSRNGIIRASLIIIAASFFIYSSVGLNFYRYTDPAEPLIQASQPPQKYSLFIDKINEVSSQYQGNSTDIQITDGELETQFLWYLRHFDSVHWRVNINSTLDAPLIITHDGDGTESDAIIVKRNLRSDYDRLDSAKMSWYWFKPSDITLDYILVRKMDRAPSEYRVVLYSKPKS
ncbi:MAG: flippase activity-associated protein Agl23 [Candidatus Methanoperedens sp.]